MRKKNARNKVVLIDKPCYFQLLQLLVHLQVIERRNFYKNRREKKSTKGTKTDIEEFFHVTLRETNLVTGREI